MSSIAKPPSGSGSVDAWGTPAGDSTQILALTGELFTPPGRTVHEVIDTGAEQPWAEFCMGLDKPAFLLPITGFVEL